jgi:hypothetical protein
MDKLVTDLFTRRICQIVVAAVFIGVAAAPFVFLIILYFYHAGWISVTGGTMPIASFFLRALALPIEDSAAQVAGAFVVAFPGLVAGVCFLPTLDPTNKPVSSDKLNIVGQGATIVLILGGIAALLSVILLGVDGPAIKAIVPDYDNLATLLKGVFGGLLAFNILYVTTLLGIRNETSK